MKKAELRKNYLDKRVAFSQAEIEAFSEAIFQNFLVNFDLSKVKNVHCFLSIKKFKEINTQFFIDYFWKNNIEVYVPKISGGDIISVKFEKSTELRENSWGILEPKSNRNHSTNDFEVLIIPSVYCDRNGNRIGYGKGFYDRFLKKINRDGIKTGLNLFLPNEEISDISIDDVALDYLVTPTETLSFLAGISKFTK